MTIGLFLKEGGYYEGSNNYYCFNANCCINRCFHNVLLQINKGNSKFDNK